MNTIPSVLEPLELAALLPHEDLLIVDLSGYIAYLRGHIPGAVHLDYANLVLGQPPAPGQMPPPEQLRRALQSIGLSREKHLVAYDDQGNGRASRLLWTLEAVGHAKCSVLNGGLGAWHSEGHAIARGPNSGNPAKAAKADNSDNPPKTDDLSIEWNPAVIADKEYVLAALGNAQITLLDARTPEEYQGLKSPSQRNGHIPGAVNLNWLDTLDPDNHYRLKPKAELNAMLARLGIERDQEIITYCQTHHRSAHSFVMLRHLGFDNLRGYPGSWSEWGNDPSLPIE